MNIRKGDGVILHNGDRGIVTSNVFKMTSLFDRDAVSVAFEFEDTTLEMPIDLPWIAEVWRNGQPVDSIQQLELFEVQP